MVRYLFDFLTGRIIIGKNIYDMSSFMKRHPGGSTIILRDIGLDVTNYFTDKKYKEDKSMHSHSRLAMNQLPKLAIGRIGGKSIMNLASGFAINKTPNQLEDGDDLTSKIIKTSTLGTDEKLGATIRPAIGGFQQLKISEMTASTVPREDANYDTIMYLRIDWKDPEYVYLNGPGCHVKVYVIL